jgi:hypothetical protein
LAQLNNLGFWPVVRAHPFILADALSSCARPQ